MVNGEAVELPKILGLEVKELGLVNLPLLEYDAKRLLQISTPITHKNKHFFNKRKAKKINNNNNKNNKKLYRITKNMTDNVCRFLVVYVVY